MQSNICASNSQNTAVIKKALQCLSSWLSNPLVYTDELASSPFFISICALLVFQFFFHFFGEK